MMFMDYGIDVTRAFFDDIQKCINRWILIEGHAMSMSCVCARWVVGGWIAFVVQKHLFACLWGLGFSCVWSVELQKVEGNREEMEDREGRGALAKDAKRYSRLVS